jgi:hypothetical protein
MQTSIYIFARACVTNANKNRFMFQNGTTQIEYSHLIPVDQNTFPNEDIGIWSMQFTNENNPVIVSLNNPKDAEAVTKLVKSEILRLAACEKKFKTLLDADRLHGAAVELAEGVALAQTVDELNSLFPGVFNEHTISGDKPMHYIVATLLDRLPGFSATGLDGTLYFNHCNETRDLFDLYHDYDIETEGRIKMLQYRPLSETKQVIPYLLNGKNPFNTLKSHGVTPSDSRYLPYLKQSTFGGIWEIINQLNRHVSFDTDEEGFPTYNHFNLATDNVRAQIREGFERAGKAVIEEVDRIKAVVRAGGLSRISALLPLLPKSQRTEIERTQTYSCDNEELLNAKAVNLAFQVVSKQLTPHGASAHLMDDEHYFDMSGEALRDATHIDIKSINKLEKLDALRNQLPLLRLLTEPLSTSKNVFSKSVDVHSPDDSGSSCVKSYCIDEAFLSDDRFLLIN